MTVNDFNAICQSLSIDPQLAIECDRVREQLISFMAGDINRAVAIEIMAELLSEIF